jgi:hypothetical protein
MAEFIHIYPFPQANGHFSPVTINIPQSLTTFEKNDLVEDVDRCFTGAVVDNISTKLYNLNLMLLTERLLPFERRRKQQLYECLIELHDVCQYTYGFVETE